MEGMKLKLIFETLTIILLISIVSGASGPNFYERIRRPRGISSMVAQIFFGGRPGLNFNPGELTSASSYMPTSTPQRSGYNYGQSRRQSQSKAYRYHNQNRNSNYDFDESQPDHSTWDDYYKSQSHNNHNNQNQHYQHRHYQRQPSQEDSSVMDSETVMSPYIRRPQGYPQQQSSPSSHASVTSDPAALGSNYMTNFVKGHEHFKENFVRGHDHFKESFVQGHEHLKYNFIKGHEHLRNDFVRGHEQLKHKVASYWNSFMPNHAKPVHYTENYNRHPVFVDEYSR